MRVAAHNGATIWGGAERATTLLLRGLKDRGHEVILLCNDELVAKQAAARGVPTRMCRIGGDILLHDSFRLASALRSFRADAFIVGTYKKLFLATLGARMAGVPRIVARVGLESDTPRSLKYRIALRRWTDGVVVNAQRMVAPFAGLDGFGADKVTVINNGVDFPGHSERISSLRAELGIDPDAVVIGTVARLAKQKRIDRLIEVAALLPPDVHVLIAGDGTRRASLETIAVQRGVSSRVHFLGHREDKDAVFDAIDIFVITSDSEGLSNSMLEAMARGVPVVSTPVSGADDALLESEHGSAAGVVAGFDVESIAGAIKDLAASEGRRKDLGAAARDRAKSVFSVDSMLDKWEAFLSPAVNERAQ